MRFAASMSLAPIALAIRARMPVVKPIIIPCASCTTTPDTPTAATAASPSFPTQIMSMVGPSDMRVWVIVMGQESASRFLSILPWVQSLPIRRVAALSFVT